MQMSLKKLAHRTIVFDHEDFALRLLRRARCRISVLRKHFLT
jgi:hypothetical protein